MDGEDERGTTDDGEEDEEEEVVARVDPWTNTLLLRGPALL